jgi:hypothetical protein
MRQALVVAAITLDLLTTLMAQAPAQRSQRVPKTIEVLGNVDVVHNSVPKQQRGRLYLDDNKVMPFRLKKGETFVMVGVGSEGGCRIRFKATIYGLASCPWLDGFTDHQDDIFRVVK